jgi:hypothetical protein
LAQTAADQYRKALDQAEGIKQAAVEELKKAISEKLAELNSFGFDFRLSRAAGASAANGRKRGPSTKQKFCRICNLAGHDARNHRNQDPQKKFTKAEMEQRGLPAA